MTKILKINILNNRIVAAIIAAAIFSCLYLDVKAQSSVLDQIISKAELLHQDVVAAVKQGNIDEAIRLSDEELALLSPNGIIADYTLYANALHQQAVNYSVKKRWDDAIKCEEEATAIFIKRRVDNQFIASCKANLSSYHIQRDLPGDIERARVMAEESLDLSSSGSTEFFNAANNLILCYSRMGKTENAKKLSAKILKRSKTMQKKDVLRYAQLLATQSMRNAHDGDFDAAIALNDECMEIYTEQQADATSEYARLLMNTANYYSHKENYNKTIELLEKAKDILLQTDGEQSLDYIKCISELSSAYNSVGNLEKANDYVGIIQSAAIENDQNSNGSLAKAQSLMKQASVFAGVGNYKNAVAIAESAVNMLMQYNDTVQIASMLNTLSAYYSGVGNQEKAIATSRKSLELYSTLQGHKNDEALGLGNIARYSYIAHDYDKALEYGKSAVEKYRMNGDSLSTFYAKALGNYAIYCQAHGDLQSAVKHSKEALQIQSSVQGTQHPDNVVTLYNLASFYDLQGNVDSMQTYYGKALKLQTEVVRRNFSHLSTAGREMFWSTKKNVFNVASTYAYMRNTNDSLLSYAYNSCLMTKGILLNSEIDFRETLMRSGNTALLEKYNRLGEMVKRQEALFQKENNSGETDRLQQQIVRLEREIMRESKLFGDFTDNMSITVERISSSMKPDEAAVELFDVPTANGHVYYALIMRCGWKAPRYAFLFSDNYLNQITHEGLSFHQLLKKKDGVDYIFGNPEVGSMVWNNIIKEMGEGVKDIYFSPTGLFYQWGIEYLCCDKGERINEKYGIHRVSSTKVLAQRKEAMPMTSAVVYGGIDYNIPVEVMKEVKDGVLVNYAPVVVSSTDSISVLNDSEDVTFEKLSATRGSLDYLPFTSEEADSIAEQLMSKGLDVKLYKEEQAIEESFKSLSGKTTSVLHIATHGFALGENASSRNELALILGASNAERDMTLNYSGLLFAGANNILSGKKIPQGLDNGILTAKEISMMDLRNLDLVVLSACQTGLGDIKEDGVFGLQRGFKKAGAHTILMSLWSVNDRATQLMMTSFYANLQNGMERNEAFRMAQQHVRDSGFSDPYYWASFILLDDK